MVVLYGEDFLHPHHKLSILFYKLLNGLIVFAQN
jgi:hypothetical protein